MRLLIKALMLMAIWVSVVNSAVLTNEPQQIEINVNDLPNDTQTLYNKIQDFFNTLFGNRIKLNINNPNEKSIEGLITYQGNPILNGEYKVIVRVEDVSRMDAASLILSESIYYPNSFPIDFNVKVNENDIKPWFDYTLSVRIEKNNLLSFISTSRNEILENGKLITYPILVNVDRVGKPPVVLPTIVPLPVPVTPGPVEPMPVPPLPQPIPEPPMPKPNVQKVEGLITFNGDQHLANDSIIIVSVEEISRADAPSKTLSTALYTNKNSFPINFAILINENDIDSYGTYSLTVRIDQKNKMVFRTTYRTDILDNGKIVGYPILVAVERVDAPLTPVTYPAPPAPTETPYCPPVTSESAPAPANQGSAPTVTIKGELQCTGLCVPNLSEFGPQRLTIFVRDVSLADAASKLIATKTVDLGNNWSFPLKYEIEFDPSDIIADPWKSFSIGARVNKCDGRLSFITDERNEIVDRKNFTIRSTVNMHVVRI